MFNQANMPPWCRPMTRPGQAGTIRTISNLRPPLPRPPLQPKSAIEPAAVISAPSRMWRSLPPEKKFEYKRVAMKTVCPPRPRRTQANRQDANPEERTRLIPSIPLQTTLESPFFPIFPRGSFGADAALASQNRAAGASRPNQDIVGNQEILQ
jgi:hypothetical protein